MKARAPWFLVIAVALAGCDDLPSSPDAARPQLSSSIDAGTYVPVPIAYPYFETVEGRLLFEPFSMNVHGQVTADANVVESGVSVRRGVVWSTDGVVVLPPLRATHDATHAMVVGDDGRVFGLSHNSMLGGGLVPTMWSNGLPSEVVMDLGQDSPETYKHLRTFNGVGQALLISRMGTESFLWDDGTTTPLVSLYEGGWAIAEVMNDLGHVVGRSVPPGGGSSQWTMWTAPDEPRAMDFGTAPQPGWQAVAMNTRGQILMNSSPCGRRTKLFSWSAFVWQDGVVTALPGMGDETETCAYAMNNDGDIMGTVHSPEGGDRKGEPAPGTWVIWSRTAVEPPPGTTLPGSDVNVTPIDRTTGEPSPATIVFENVSGAGETTVTSAPVGAGGPPAPAGFRIGNPPTYFDIQTTASFSGRVTVCLSYSGVSYPNTRMLRLLHHDGNAWQDITVSVDVVAEIVCGETDSLSPFLVAQELFPFTGFFRPIENLPGMNVARAGSAIPVKFSLGGDRGLSIFGDAPPVSRAIECVDESAATAGEPIAMRGESELAYDGTADQYVFTWSTERAWQNSCRELVVHLVDGSEHRARFQFR